MNDLHIWGIHLVYYLLVLAFLLPRIPVVGKFFNLINTLLHEFGHALFALLLQGQVVNIQIFKDTSGVTLTKSKSRFAAFIVSLAGYPFASVAAYVCSFLLSVGYERWIVAGLSILFLIVLCLWIRNAYGALWVLAFAALNAFLLFYVEDPQYTQVAAWFYTLMILLESVWSTFVLIYLAFSQPDKAGDASNLHNFTHIPSLIWSLLFAAFAVWMGYLSVLRLQILPLG